MNVGVLYYRADLLAKYGLAPPRTWEALVEQAELIRARERDPKLDGVLWQGKQYEGLVCNVVEQFWASGTALFSDDGGCCRISSARRGRAGVHARPDRPRREPGLGDRRRRGADAPGVRRRPGRSSCARGPTRWISSSSRTLRCAGAWASRPCRGTSAGAAGVGTTGGVSSRGEPRAHATPRPAVALVRFLGSERGQRALTAAGVALYPTPHRALSRSRGASRAHPNMPRFHDLALAGAPAAGDAVLPDDLDDGAAGVLRRARPREDPARGARARPACASSTCWPSGDRAPARRPARRAGVRRAGRARARRAGPLSGPLGALALAAAADPDLRHRALRRRRPLRLPGRRPAHVERGAGDARVRRRCRSRSSWCWGWRRRWRCSGSASADGWRCRCCCWRGRCRRSSPPSCSSGSITPRPGW